VSEKQLKPVQLIQFYLLWVVSSAISVVDWLTLRSALSATAAVIAESVPMEAQSERQWYLRWTVSAVDKFALAVLGIAAMVSIISLDYIYRDAIGKGVIQRRFGTVTAVQASLLILSAIAILLSFCVLGAT
jgi:hypothetical protein